MLFIHFSFIYFQQRPGPSAEEVTPVASTSTADDVFDESQQVRNCQN